MRKLRTSFALQFAAADKHCPGPSLGHQGPSSVPCLKECDSNWKNAEAQPGLLQQLIDEEIAQGWVAEVHGGEAAARLRWPKGIQEVKRL